MQFLTIASATMASIITSVAAQGTSTTTAGSSSSTGSVTGELGDATIVSSNPAGVGYSAILPIGGQFAGYQVKGGISAIADPSGTGVAFSVNFSDLPSSGGPFIYHIHSAPVPVDGNCTGTLAHLDPFIRGETPACDASHPETCQVGDLSGKYGNIDDTYYSTTFVDDFASTQYGLGSFFGNRSFVIHFANKTRIACANFASAAPASTACSTTASTTYPSSTLSGVAIPTINPFGGGSAGPLYNGTPTSTTPAQFTGVGNTLATPGMAMLVITAIATFLL